MSTLKIMESEEEGRDAPTASRGKRTCADREKDVLTISRRRTVIRRPL